MMDVEDDVMDLWKKTFFLRCAFAFAAASVTGGERCWKAASADKAEKEGNGDDDHGTALQSEEWMEAGVFLRERC